MPNNLVLPTPGSKGSSRTSSKTVRSRQQSSSLSFVPALATLTLGKASRVFAAFVSFHYLQDRVALPLYLFFVTVGAALTLVALQRPWTGKRIGAKRGRRVILAGGLLALTLYVWTAGLRSAGPLRTLLVDGAELPLLYLFAVVTRRELPERRKTRGALCMLAAYCLLIWDASGHVPDVKEIEHSRFGRRAEHMVGRLTHRGAVGWAGQDNLDQNSVDAPNEGLAQHVVGDDNDDGMRHRRRRLLTTFRPRVKGPGGVKDVFVEGTALRCEVGVILVLLASVLVQAGRGFSRRLASELGGAKRHFALSMSAACGWITPLALLSWISNATGSVLSFQVIGGVTRMSVTTGHALGFVGVGFLWLVLPYYARAIVSTVIPSRIMVQSSVVIPFVMASVVSVGFGGAASVGGLSWVLFAAFALECIGVSLMMAGGAKRGLSELPIDTSGSTVSRAGDSDSGRRSGALSETENGMNDANGVISGGESERDGRN